MVCTLWHKNKADETLFFFTKETFNVKYKIKKKNKQMIYFWK